MQKYIKQIKNAKSKEELKQCIKVLKLPKDMIKSLN